MSDRIEQRAEPRRLPVIGVRPKTALIGLPILLLAVPLFYYGLLPLFLQRIDDDTTFAPAKVEAGGSHAVAVAAALIRREVDLNGWTPNDPVFQPTAMLDNMPNFQKGMASALARFVIEMRDFIGRARGSSKEDTDLVAAAGKLNYSPTQWHFDSSSFGLNATTESQYTAAREALERYNLRLGIENAVFERRSDNLLSTLERFLADIGALSETIQEKLEDSNIIGIDLGADDRFYETKGRLYVYFLLTRALGRDFARVIEEKELTTVWAKMEQSLEQAAALDPLMILNASPDSMFPSNHLAAQGFYLLRARTQMREVTNILLK